MAVNILTIDIDYIAHHYNRLMENSLGLDDPTEQYWEAALTAGGLTEHALVADLHNLKFMYRTFVDHMLRCDNVVFGYYHDTILNNIDLNSTEEVNIINIDHHHDIWYSDTQYKTGVELDLIYESNWVLKLRDRISNYLWVGNHNSLPFKGQVPFNFRFCLKEDEIIFPKSFDLIYVTMSPRYLAPQHWHYFWLLKDIYDGVTDSISSIDKTRYSKIMEDFYGSSE